VLSGDDLGDLLTRDQFGSMTCSPPNVVGVVVNCQSHFDDWFKGVEPEIVKVDSASFAERLRLAEPPLRMRDDWKNMAQT
jgi:hypothetical protein